MVHFFYIKRHLMLISKLSCVPSPNSRTFAEVALAEMHYVIVLARNCHSIFRNILFLFTFLTLVIICFFF